MGRLVQLKRRRRAFLCLTVDTAAKRFSWMEGGVTTAGTQLPLSHQWRHPAVIKDNSSLLMFSLCTHTTSYTPEVGGVSGANLNTDHIPLTRPWEIWQTLLKPPVRAGLTQSGFRLLQRSRCTRMSEIRAWKPLEVTKTILLLSFQLHLNTCTRLVNVDVHQCYKTETFGFSYHSRFFKSASKPKEKSRSASSTTSISRDECRSRFWALRCASTRDGVPTTTSGFSIRMGLFEDDMLSVAARDKRQWGTFYNSWMNSPLRWQVSLSRDVGHPDVPWAVRR